VTLIEVQGAESIVRMRRRFDRSELNWLFFTPALFRALNATEAREQEQHAALLQALKPYGSFQIDMSQGRITFAPKTGSSLEPRSYAFELVGSWSEKTRRLLWAFANESAHPRLKRRSERVRAQSTELGLRALHEGDLGCPEKMAERLARHVAVVTEATGLYRAPFKSELGAGFMYLALIDAQPSTVGPT
jgi:hypothetical protein